MKKCFKLPIRGVGQIGLGGAPVLGRRRMQRMFLVGFFSCHIALVVAGAAHLTPNVHGPVGRGLRFYNALSGAGDSYSFFAPTVGPQLRARLDRKSVV